jgi:hypothetical protein
MHRLIAILCLVPLLALAGAPPIDPHIAWQLDNTHILVTWEQGISGQRCFALESPHHARIEYGCVWIFQGVGRIVLPSGGPVAPAALPAPGDTIFVDSTPLLVPARPVRLFFPLASR